MPESPTSRDEALGGLGVLGEDEADKQSADNGLGALP